MQVDQIEVAVGVNSSVGYSLLTWPSFPHVTHMCLYQQSLAWLMHFSWLNSQQASLLLHTDPLPHCMLALVSCAPCGARSPAALLKMCCTSRNLDFLNWWREKLLTFPDHHWITLLRLGTCPCPDASEEAKYAMMYSP